MTLLTEYWLKLANNCPFSFWAVETASCLSPWQRGLAGASRVRLTLRPHFSVRFCLCPNLRCAPSIRSVQFSLVAQSCPTPCDPMDCSTPGFPRHRQLLELAQTRVHWIGDAIQPSHPLSPSPPAPNSSQHQGLFQWVSSSHQVAKVLELQLQHQSFQWTPRTDLL